MCIHLHILINKTYFSSVAALPIGGFLFHGLLPSVNSCPEADDLPPDVYFRRARVAQGHVTVLVLCPSFHLNT